MTSTCQQCLDYEFKQYTGSWPDGQAFNRWAMWGCTCEPGSAEAALAYIRLVSD